LGVLQQYASPIEIYNNLANLFVAKFIGIQAHTFEMPPLTDGGATKLDFVGGWLHRSDRSQVGGAEPPGAQAGRGFEARPEQLELRRDNGHASSLSMTPRLSRELAPAPLCIWSATVKP
jgi:ABC-type sugar transport system ATPase subunit